MTNRALPSKLVEQRNDLNRWWRASFILGVFFTPLPVISSSTYVPHTSTQVERSLPSNIACHGTFTGKHLCPSRDDRGAAIDLRRHSSKRHPSTFEGSIDRIVNIYNNPRGSVGEFSNKEFNLRTWKRNRKLSDRGKLAFDEPEN